jgi:hypothetical protein
MMIEEYIPLCKNCESSALEFQGTQAEEDSIWLEYECHSCGEFTRFHYAKDAVEGAEPIRIESSPINNRSKLRSLEIELTDEQAYALAQYLKRVQYDDFRRRAIDEDDAYLMQNAASEVRKALNDAGYDPR